MKKILNKIFHLNEKNVSIKNEVLGGAITFVAMCYILPTNASILSSMGMDSAGVFAVTAIVSFIVTMIMGVVANYPISLSAGMGLNAFIAYTLSSELGFNTWQQKMILLTIAGIIFFAFSLTPIRKIIIEAIPKNLRCIISACLGGFILFVGLKSSGIIVDNPSTLVTLGNFADPAMIVGFAAIVICFGLMFVKNKIVSALAIPISILSAAIVGTLISTIMYYNNSIVYDNTVSTFVYNVSYLSDTQVNLPIAPWISNAKFGVSGIEKVFFFGLFDSSSSYSWSDFGSDLFGPTSIFLKPSTYIAIFSLMFVNLFDTTATLVAIGEKIGLIDSEGKITNYRKAVLADAAGALICAPFGTSTVTSFAESNVGVSIGAKTGLAAVSSALLFLLSAFIYPIFSIFTAGCVTVAALVAVGATIIVSSISQLDKNDLASGFTAVIAIIFAILTYSISNGIGIGLIVYVVIMLISKRGKEIKPAVYVIASLFIVSFVATTVLSVI